MILTSRSGTDGAGRPVLHLSTSSGERTSRSHSVDQTDEVTTLLAPITTLPPEFRPLRVEEYHQLIELGVFEGTKVELVGGVLVEMSPQGPAHLGADPLPQPPAGPAGRRGLRGQPPRTGDR